MAAEYKIQSGNNQIETPLPTNPGTAYIINALLKGQQAGMDQANQLSSQQAAEAVANRKREADLAAAQKIAATGKASSVGEAQIGAPSDARNQMALQKEQADQAQKLQKIYGKDADKLNDAASQVEAGLVGLNAGSPSGDKTAVAALTRLADGKGARLTQSQLASMMPKSWSGSTQDMMNYVSGLADSGLTPDQRNSMRGLLMAHSGRLEKEANDSADEFKAQAPLIAPSLAASGQLDNYLNSFGSKTAGTFKRIQDLANTSPTQSNPGAIANAANAPSTQLAGAPSEGIIPAIGKSLQGLKNYLMGVPTQGTAQVSPTTQALGSPVSAPAAQLPGGIAAADIQAEIEKRKKAKAADESEEDDEE